MSQLWATQNIGLQKTDLGRLPRVLFITVQICSMSQPRHSVMFHGKCNFIACLYCPNWYLHVKKDPSLKSNYNILCVFKIGLKEAQNAATLISVTSPGKQKNKSKYTSVFIFFRTSKFCFSILTLTNLKGPYSIFSIFIGLIVLKVYGHM